MHILNINTLYPPQVIGGAELGVHQLSKGMVAAGHRLDVISLAPPRTPPSSQIFDGVHVHREPLANLYWPYSQETRPELSIGRMAWHLIDTGNPIMARRVARLVGDIRPDVVLTHNLQGFSTLVIPLVAALGFPIVHVIHDLSLLCPRTAMYRDGARCGTGPERCRDCALLTAPRARHLQPLCGVIGVSEAVLSLHVEHGLFRQVPKRVIHNALRDALILRGEPRRRPNRDLRFGFIGRIDRPKGIETLLEAARLAQQSGRRFQLKIAGRGQPEYVQELQRRWQINGAEYLGFTDPAAFYSDIDVLIFPSDSREALGNVVIEAYSQGVPVIATDSGGVAEIIVPGITGFITAPGDAPRIARCMVSLCDDPGRLVDLSRAALAQAENYLVPSRVSAYLDALEHFLPEAA